MHKAPCTKHSISILEFAQIYSISFIESSLAKTTLLNPIFSSSKTPSKLCIDICVLAWISKPGKFLINKSAKPKSWTIIASIPNSYAFLANVIASSNSLFTNNVFKVKLVFTPRSLA